MLPETSQDSSWGPCTLTAILKHLLGPGTASFAVAFANWTARLASTSAAWFCLFGLFRPDGFKQIPGNPDTNTSGEKLPM